MSIISKVTNAVKSKATVLTQTGPKLMSSTTKAHLTTTRFDSFPLSNNTLRALREKLKYDCCTQVQAESLPVCLGETDVVTKAKTGTGKTLAFLIPAIEHLVKNPPSRKNMISILIISPTRELANQIKAEAQAIAEFHKMIVQVVVGGTDMKADIKQFKRQMPDILVATPGRINDHLESETSVKNAVSALRTLIFDEADRLLDMGFRPAIEKLLQALPDKKSRQTYLFSATFPKNIQTLASFALRPGYKMVDTIGEEQNSAELIDQQSMVVPFGTEMATLWNVVQAHKKETPDFKIIIFCVTAKITQLHAELFNAMGEPALEIHSRKSQAVRTRVAEQFKVKKGVILFTSDVSARGVDYPDVTLVIQVGLPSTKEDYIHRVGRTARAGKNGLGLIILGDLEQFFLQDLRDLPITPATAVPEAQIIAAKKQIEKALKSVSSETKDAAYRTWLGFYKGHAKRMRGNMAQLVAQAALYSEHVGCNELPSFEPITVRRMGLEGVPGLRIEKSHGGFKRNSGSGRDATSGLTPGTSGAQAWAQKRSLDARGGKGKGRGGFQSGHKHLPLVDSPPANARSHIIFNDDVSSRASNFEVKEHSNKRKGNKQDDQRPYKKSR